jgi:hypothetical protein
MVDTREKMAPVQGYTPGIPWEMHLEAYDAYRKKWGAQPALIDLEGRGCRGGFSTGELDDFIPGWRERLGERTAMKKRIAELEAQVADLQTRPAKLEDSEQYRMQMAAIGTASFGYWKPVDGILPEYDTVPLRDVAGLYAKYEVALARCAELPMYTCAGKGGQYELLGVAKGAGTSRETPALAVYRDTKTAALYFRTEGDFAARMESIDRMTGLTQQQKELLHAAAATLDDLGAPLNATDLRAIAGDL